MPNNLTEKKIFFREIKRQKYIYFFVKLNDLYIIFQRPTADIKAPLFTVLGNVLLYNWRHFFKSSVMRSLIGAPSPIRNQSDQVQHKVQFLAILNALGQSFLQPDIVVFKQNLITLEKLNEKWKLYHKVLNPPIHTLKSRYNEQVNQTLFVHYIE